MRITVVTAFPDLIRGYLGFSVIGRGVSSGALEVQVLDLRDFAEGSYRQVDDYSFGGGGMVLMAEPLTRALVSADPQGDAFVVYPSPQGVHLHQELVEELASKEHLVLVCGHYEGVDERFVREHVDLEISLGDFVLTGGELPAMAVLDAVARLVPGVVGRMEAVREDSFYRGFLDHPHYTRPAVWRGIKAPEELLGGDHGVIEEFRRRERVRRTLERRPDLLARTGLNGHLNGGFYVYVGEEGEDPFKLLPLCGAFGGVRLLAHRSIKGDQPGEGVKFFPSFGAALRWITSRERAKPLVLTAGEGGDFKWLSAKRRVLEYLGPSVIALGGRFEGDVLLGVPRSSRGPVSLGETLCHWLTRFFQVDDPGRQGG
ncbi:tRNA (guanine-N1)-methyltransferase [Thermanaerovibrio velox DSM 12556]|uniref:tRNA (guanine-N(1)-)-methyltransferase n=1 Tax=Thermanaerovibrio velox DSM 12556 TaxID=926567 RepID=H0UP88_9BACT|nr:tRNA (guanosine(37)-N1)-methyltransferase TrmD [Thermanaerovibrio velox]EHM09501.1 tRNA (guanine-N1)-methyltransferase [Thermanaerovibrio velox DSM 12556]